MAELDAWSPSLAMGLAGPLPAGGQVQAELRWRVDCTEDWDYYDANHVVFRPKLLTPEKLLEGYHHVMKEFYSVSSIFRRLWGTTAWKNLFYPMNFGFRQSVRGMLHDSQGPDHDRFGRQHHPCFVLK